MDIEAQLLEDLYRYLIDNTDNTKYVWFSGEDYDEFWRNEGGPIYSALFWRGPRTALLGIGQRRYFTADPVFSNIYIQPIAEPEIGYQENRARQLFEVCIGNAPGLERKVEGRGFRGVANILRSHFYDEYNRVNDRRLHHREHVDALNRYLHGIDHRVADATLMGGGPTIEGGLGNGRY